MTAGAKRGVGRFEPQQSIPRIPLLQVLNDAKCLSVTSFAVVDEDERKERIGLDMARVSRRLLDKANSSLAAAVEPGHPSDEPQCQGQAGDPVSIEANRERGVRALRIER
jgi:hypothetical protein